MRRLLLFFLMTCIAMQTAPAAEVIQKKGQKIIVTLTQDEARFITSGSNITLLDGGSEVSRGLIILSSKNPRKAQIQISGNPDRIATGNVYRLATVNRNGSLRYADDAEADGAWVKDEPESYQRPESRPLISLKLGGGHRLFRQNGELVMHDQDQNSPSEASFRDVIEPLNSFEIRSYVHILSFLSLGLGYHIDEARFKVNNQAVPLSLQEAFGSVQLGPRFGSVHLYALYNQVISSRSTSILRAPTLVSDPGALQEYEIETKQTGRDAGLGVQLQFGHLGVFMEALQSLDRRFELNITQKAQNAAKPSSVGVESKFSATAITPYKAWQVGLSLDF